MKSISLINTEFLESLSVVIGIITGILIIIKTFLQTLDYISDRRIKKIKTALERNDFDSITKNFLEEEMGKLDFYKISKSYLSQNKRKHIIELVENSNENMNYYMVLASHKYFKLINKKWKLILTKKDFFIIFPELFLLSINLIMNLALLILVSFYAENLGIKKTLIFALVFLVSIYVMSTLIERPLKYFYARKIKKEIEEEKKEGG